jgi:hypothetical protein
MMRVPPSHSRSLSLHSPQRPHRGGQPRHAEQRRQLGGVAGLGGRARRGGRRGGGAVKACMLLRVVLCLHRRIYELDMLPGSNASAFGADAASEEPRRHIRSESHRVSPSLSESQL